MLLRKCHDMVHQFPTIENIISNRQLESLKSQMSFRLSVVHQKSKPRVRNSQIQCTGKVHVYAYSCKCVVSVTFVYWHSSSGYDHIGAADLGCFILIHTSHRTRDKIRIFSLWNRKLSKNFSWNILQYTVASKSSNRLHHRHWLSWQQAKWNEKHQITSVAGVNAAD